jgi:hypothetical protein
MVGKTQATRKEPTMKIVLSNPAAIITHSLLQALPRLVFSFYVLAGHGPTTYTYDDVAIACLIRLLGVSRRLI